jgi:N-acetylmuramoyl-L-alanine amidase
VSARRDDTRLRALLLLALLLAAPSLAAPAPARPDAALYREAQRAEATLRATPKRQARREEWERVVVLYRRVVARYPRSGYCDNALLAVGNLYRDMLGRFRSARYGTDAVAAYRTMVREYPSSSLGEKALYEVVQLASRGKDRPSLARAAEAYLDHFPEGARAGEVRALLRRRAPATPLPSPPPRGLAQVFDLRFWSGEASTRVVLDLERQVTLQSDRVAEPDRLWIDLVGTRLHPNLRQRAFPVGDGLLRQVRIAQNRPDAVRVVLDLDEVEDHSIIYLGDPPRLVVDVRGRARPGRQLAEAGAAGAQPLGSRPVEGLARPPEAAPAPVAAGRGQEPLPQPPQPPATNRTGAYSLARQLGLGARRIVIDPGHGGHDPGTIGRHGLQEKDVVLDVALRLARLIRAELGTEVLLTRSTDVFLPLEERTAIANSSGADLFLSIHANASRNHRARGIETYFLSFARSAHAEAVAARENAISQATLNDLQRLVRAITLSSKIDESRDLASSVQEGLVTGLRSHHRVEDRGVHTAPFYVLIGATMPAILAEIAFVSHPDDEKRLGKGDYREVLAQGLLRGVRAYLESLDRNRMRQLTRAPLEPTVGTGSAPR